MNTTIVRSMTDEHLRSALSLLRSGKYDVRLNFEDDVSVFDHTQTMPKRRRWVSLTIDRWDGAAIADEALAVLNRNAALEAEIETLRAKLAGIRELAR